MSERTRFFIETGVLVLLVLGVLAISDYFMSDELSGVTYVSSEPRSKEPAVRLDVVSTGGCGACRRFKLYTYPVLIAEGYDVVLYNASNYPESVTVVPTLIYRDKKGNEILREVGFRTPKQVKQFLSPIREVSVR